MGAIDIAASGMRVQTRSLDVIANNIANISTSGFKAGTLSFQEANVTSYGQEPNGVINQTGNGVSAAGVTSDWSPGPMAQTGASGDLAVSGAGFIPVSYQGAVRYVRTGSFQLVPSDPSAPGGAYRLETADGATLLGGSGVKPDGTIAGLSASSYVEFSSAPTSFKISPDGKVTASPDGASVTNALLGVQRFNNPDSLAKNGAGLYEPSSLSSYSTGGKGSEAPSVPGRNSSGAMTQGTLEMSNVSLTTELSSMLLTGRGFKASAKAIRSANDMFETLLSM